MAPWRGVVMPQGRSSDATGGAVRTAQGTYFWGIKMRIRRRIKRKWMPPQWSGAKITPIYLINVINQTIPLNIKLFVKISKADFW